MDDEQRELSVSLETVQAGIDAIAAMDLEAQWRLTKFDRRLLSMKRELEARIPQADPR
jgi:aryl carrier-like protein